MRVLHVNDAASSTHQLLAEARTRGLDWRYLPLAAHHRTWRGVRGHAQRAALGAAWEARLAAAAARAALLHVHGGTVVRHTGWVPRPYVLHLHGTDARSHQYDPAQQRVVRRGMARAAAVLYSTPDLAEHVLPLRPDAEHFPQPLDLAGMPPLTPPDRPTVLFASRWEAVKGLPAQLETAARLRAALPPGARLVGLDWGPGAGDAARAGVELLPRRDRAGYLRLLAGASVVVGQASGMLAASELEAMAVGVPVAARLDPRWYPGDGAPPVLVGRDGPVAPAALADDVTDAVVACLAGGGTATADAARAWVARHHDVRDGVSRLTALYARVLPPAAGAAPAGR